MTIHRTTRAQKIPPVLLPFFMCRTSEHFETSVFFIVFTIHSDMKFVLCFFVFCRIQDNTFFSHNNLKMYSLSLYITQINKQNENNAILEMCSAIERQSKMIIKYWITYKGCSKRIYNSCTQSLALRDRLVKNWVAELIQ